MDIYMLYAFAVICLLAGAPQRGAAETVPALGSARGVIRGFARSLLQGGLVNLT